MTPRSLRLVTRLLALALVIWGGVALAPSLRAQEESGQATVIIDQVDGSGVTGDVVLTAAGNQTVVWVRLTGALEVHSVHLHDRACGVADLAAEAAPGHLVAGWSDPDGYSELTVEAPLSVIWAGPYSVVVHRSDAELGQYLACGNVGETAAQPAAANEVMRSIGDNGATTSDPAPAVAVTEVTPTGVGSMAGGGAEMVWLTLGLAVIAAAIAIGLAKRQEHGIIGRR